MSANRFFFDGKESLYIRFTDSLELPHEITLAITKDLAGKTIKITSVEDDKNIKNNTIPEYPNCNYGD